MHQLICMNTAQLSFFCLLAESTLDVAGKNNGVIPQFSRVNECFI